MHGETTRISQTVSELRISAIKEMAMRSAALPDAVSLAWGVPSFATPAVIRQAVARALEDDPEVGKYSLPDGLPALRQAAAAAHHAATGLAPDPDRQVMVSAGNIEALRCLLRVLIDPGDEIIVTDPGFPSHLQQIRLCGGQAIFWKMDEGRGWALDLDALPGLITNRTKAILLVSPDNPTGRVYSEAELRHIGEIAVASNVMILIDDPYSQFTFENRDRYFNLASVPALADHLVYLFTFSKCHAMTGWRLGYVVMPEVLKKEMLKVHDATIICAPRVSQMAGLAALTQDQGHLEFFEQSFARRRSLICERLAALSHVFDFVKPEAAYYVFARILVDHDDSVAFAIRLLEEAKVCLTPGRAFGPTGENHVRMAFCGPDAGIEKAFDRMEAYFGR